MELKILTYNIWFANILPTERLKSLIQIIQNLNPDIICFQEIKPQIYNILTKILSEYKFVHPENITTEYGIAIFSKIKYNKTTNYKFFNSRMGRNLISIRIKINNMDLYILTSHFESEFNKSEPNQIKLDQYNLAEKYISNLYSETNNIIFPCDTNLLESEDSKFDLIFNKYSDAWKILGNNQNKFTFDGKSNSHIKKKYQTRLDRIIYKTNNFKLKKFDLVGKSNNNNFIEPSDHYGIFIIMEYQN